MFTTSFQYYPTGFRIPLTSGFKSETLEDEAWCAHYAQLQKGIQSGDSIEFRKDTIRHARRLFGNFLDFLDAQDQNTRLCNNGYEYLKDTIEFLNTGRRTISAGSRLGLIATDIKEHRQNNPKAENRRTRLRSLLEINPDEFIFVWLNHPGGFADMLCTVNLLFGTDPHAAS